MEANAALRNIVRRDNGEGYREMHAWPGKAGLARLDRKRKGKKLQHGLPCLSPSALVHRS